MIFRKANTSDAKSLDKMLTMLIDDEAQMDEHCQKVKVKDFYINYINDPSKYIYVCEIDNNIVGYIYVTTNDFKSKIDVLYVLSEYRKQGIASKLIEDYITYAKNNKIKTITISVLSNNIDAKKLYLKYFESYKEDLRLNL